MQISAAKNNTVPKSTRESSSAQVNDVTANVRDGNGMPHLVTAARLYRADLLLDFLTGGYDVNTAIKIPAIGPKQKQNIDPVIQRTLDNFMLQRYANNHENGFTALMAAAGASIDHPKQQIEAVQVLLDAGADVNARTVTGRTALGEAKLMTDPAQHQGKIGRFALEEVLRARRTNRHSKNQRQNKKRLRRFRLPSPAISGIIQSS